MSAIAAILALLGLAYGWSRDSAGTLRREHRNY